MATSGRHNNNNNNNKTIVDFCIRPLQTRDVAAAAALLAHSVPAHNALDAAVGGSRAYLERTVPLLLARVVPQWLSLVAVTTNTDKAARVIGVLLAEDAAVSRRQPLVLAPTTDERERERRRPLSELIDELRAAAPPLDTAECGRTVHVLMQASAPTHQRRGVATALMAEIERIAAERGFADLRAECVGAPSVALWLKRGASVRFEAKLAQHSFAPFAALAGKERAAAVELRLPASSLDSVYVCDVDPSQEGDRRVEQKQKQNQEDDCSVQQEEHTQQQQQQGHCRSPAWEGCSEDGAQLLVRAQQIVCKLHADPPRSRALQKDDIDKILARYRGTSLPEEGASIDAVLAELERAMRESCANPQHGSQFAFTPGGGLWAGAVADLLTAAVNRNLLASSPAPALFQLEHNVIRWLCTAIGFARGGGVLTSGGSQSLWTATVAALHRARSLAQKRPLVAYVGRNAHHAVAKAWRLAGMPAAALRAVACRGPDDGLVLDVSDLAHQLEADVGRGGRFPALVFASGGSTFTGCVDSLDAVADVCERFGAWMHVDCAYGGGFLLSTLARPTFAGIERAHSVTIDAHKALFTPFGTGALLVRDTSLLTATFGEQKEENDGSEAQEHQSQRGRILLFEESSDDFAALGLELSRPFRALRLWLPFKLYGAARFRSALDDRVRWARDVANGVVADLRRGDGWHARVLTAPVLSILNITAMPPTSPLDVDGDIATAAQIDRFNRLWIDAVNDTQEALLSGVCLPGVAYTAVRVCVLSAMTERRHVEGLIAALRSTFEIVSI